MAARLICLTNDRILLRGVQSLFCTKFMCHTFYSLQLLMGTKFIYRIGFLNSAAISLVMNVYLWHTDFISFVYKYNIEIAESYSSIIFNILIAYDTDFHNGVRNLIYQIKFITGMCYFFFIPSLVLDFFFKITILTRVRYLIKILNWIPLMMLYSAFFIDYMLAIYISFFEKCILKPFIHLNQIELDFSYILILNRIFF